MKKLREALARILGMEKACFVPMLFSAICFVFVLVGIFNAGDAPSQSTMASILSSLSFNQPLIAPKPAFVENKIHTPVRASDVNIPRLAYLIAGSKRDGNKLKRTLAALYHPRNYYIVHLDLESETTERADLGEHIRSNPIYAQVGNVVMISKSNLITYRGPTMVANTLHAVAVLLRKFKDWDWFINLSASDYPLVTQDDLLYVFSRLPRHINFIEHTSELGWKEDNRAKPIIIDPALYMTKKTDVFWVSEHRGSPTAFKLFTGSAWMVLSRSFCEYCVWGWDNLPRSLLMYYANFISSPEGYFHTVICNAQEYVNTTVNHDLHYISWDNPPKQHPHNLGLKDFQHMLESQSPFARKFEYNSLVLDKIDRDLLRRPNGSFTPGGWCNSVLEDESSRCSSVGDLNFLEPGFGARRLQRLIDKLLSPENMLTNQCI